MTLSKRIPVVGGSYDGFSYEAGGDRALWFDRHGHALEQLAVDPLLASSELDPDGGAWRPKRS